MVKYVYNAIVIMCYSQMFPRENRVLQCIKVVILIYCSKQNFKLLLIIV